MGYFDVSGDPLSLSAERAAICLYLRRDLPVLEKAYIARVPPDAGQIYICLDGNTDTRKDVEISDLELLRAEHIAAGSVSRHLIKKK